MSQQGVVKVNSFQVQHPLPEPHHGHPHPLLWVKTWTAPPHLPYKSQDILHLVLLYAFLLTLKNTIRSDLTLNLTSSQFLKAGIQQSPLSRTCLLRPSSETEGALGEHSDWCSQDQDWERKEKSCATSSHTSSMMMYSPSQYNRVLVVWAGVSSGQSSLRTISFGIFKDNLYK